MGVEGKEGRAEDNGGLFPCEQIVTMVGYRGLVDCGEYLCRTVYRDVRIGLCRGAGDRVIRVYGCADADYRGKVFLADIYQAGIVHDSRIRGETFFHES